MKHEKLLKGFLTPQPDYRPVTMWFIGDKLDCEEITTQLETFRAKGVNEVFWNPTGGFLDDYLSPEYFEYVKHTVAECKRLGMSFWIYDEYEFPSGIAGGKLLRDRPDLRAKVLCNEKKDLNPSMQINRQYIKGKFEGAYLVFIDSPKEGAIDISADMTIEPCGDGFYASYRNLYGAGVTIHIMSSRLQHYVLSAAQGARFSWCQEGYIDALREEAMRAFIDSTHEKYKEAVGDEFGKTVKGLFTDEVCVADPHEMGFGKVPWNDEIAERFEKRFGYSLKPWLYCLVQKPVTPQEMMVRYHFWRLLTERVRDAHIKQVYEWCDENNLLYTGHFDGEESLLWSMIQSGDIFDLMEWLHVPGIDAIYTRKRIDDEDFNTAGKVVSSCARYFDRDRILCETFTGSSYKLRYDEMQRIANRLLVLGANMIQYMGSHYSMDNQRKSWKPSFNYNNTLFERLDVIGDYIARIQYVSAQSKPAGRVLVMCPQSGVYTNYDAMNGAFGRDRAASDFERYDIGYAGIVNALLELNIEYDMFSDCMASKVETSGGKATLYGAEYDVVVLPNADDTTSAVIDMVKRLQKVGTKVVFIDALPRTAVDNGVSVSPFGQTPESGDLRCVGENLWYLGESFEGKKMGQNDAFKAKLAEVIGREYRTLDIRHNGGIYTGLRTAEDTGVVFMCNDAHEPRWAEIAWKPGMQLLDPETAKSVALNPIGDRARIEFAPHQFYILLCEASDLVSEKKEIKTKVSRVLLPACGFTANDGNILAARWMYAPCKYDGGAIELPEADAFTLLDIQGVLPPKHSIPSTTGVLVFDFDAEFVPEKLRLIAEYANILRCELNGVRIDDRWSKCRLWGPKDADIDVADIVKTGHNRLCVIFETPDFPTRYFVPFVMLRGDFETDRANILPKRGEYVAAPINEQGHPAFCGSGSYVFRTVLSAEEAAETAAISVDSNDAAELIVNGKSAGVRLWKPFRYNVEGLLAEGENTLEFKMTLPMHNLFMETSYCAPDGEALSVGLTGAPRLEIKA